MAIVLIGSVARGTALAQSDLDLLVLSESTVSRVTAEAPIHAQYFTRGEFLLRLTQGDDFAAWCVRYGRPLRGADFWSIVSSSPEANTWPDWRAKLPHAARRLHMAASMLELGDVEAAIEETLYAVSHVGRAVLLKNGEFPLSRPEMVGQLTNHGFEDVARVLALFLFEEVDRRKVHSALRYVKKVLVDLDRGWFAAQDAERRRRAAAKKRRARPATFLTS